MSQSVEGILIFKVDAGSIGNSTRKSGGGLVYALGPSLPDALRERLDLKFTAGEGTGEN